MPCCRFHTTSTKQTRRLAATLAEKLQAGDVLALDGDLGAGKTTFTKGLAQGLGIKRVVNSPTFTMIKEYAGRLPLYHMDVYRLDGSGEDLGFDEYFEGGGVTLIEWAATMAEWLPAERLNIEMRRAGEGERDIFVDPHGKRYALLCEEMRHEDFGD